MSNVVQLPPLLRKKLPLSRSAMEKAMSKQLKEDAVKVLRESTHWVRLHEIDPSMPSTAFRKSIVARKMTRGQGVLSWHIQLRSGHAPLNGHLHKIMVTPRAQKDLGITPMLQHLGIAQILAVHVV